VEFVIHLESLDGPMAQVIRINGNDLTIAQFSQVVFDGVPVKLDPTAQIQMKRSRQVVEKIVRDEAPTYGINTGFGKLSDHQISSKQIEQLQVNLVRSHACGVGEPLSEAETRGMLLCRANALAKGFSGVRTEVVELLLALLNARVHPVIPSQGSVGASGDLAPLAHLALVLIGEGVAAYHRRRLKGGQALQQAGLKPLKLGAKEGLSLLNGTQAMLSVGTIALLEAENLVDTADVAAALSLDALKGTPKAFDAKIQMTRPYPGQQTSAAHMRQLLAGSEIRTSHLNCPRVQDAYSLRCIPQVHGAIRDTLSLARSTFSIELNAATDNPLVFADEQEVISGGNFHGQPLALVMDYMAIALTELASISERRIERLITPEYGDLPPFLTQDPGLNSGFMMLQVTAAALTSACKVLAHPASVDSIPTSGNREDHVSMGMGAALKLKQVLENLRQILSIELLCATQGIDLLSPLKPGQGPRKAHRLVRSVSPTVAADRTLAPDIAQVAQLIAAGKFAAILKKGGQNS
jgi:histidine ammonia-lyase